MPIIKSSIKDVRRIKRRTARNRAAKTALRTAIKNVRTAPDAEKAKSALRKAVKALDTACTRGIIHRNTASRNKSRLSAFVQKKFGK